jgi:uncharacterized protein (TIGR02145 family)
MQFYSGTFSSNGDPTINVQGICPSGWHVPSYAEQNILDQYLTDPPNTCNPNRSYSDWECANAGAKLQSGGSSGFDALMAGGRRNPSEFYDIGLVDLMWSSSYDSASGQPWLSYLGVPGYPAIGRYVWPYTVGWSVRCLKD